MLRFLGAVSDRVLPIPGGFRRGSAVYWPDGPIWVAGKVVGRRGGQVEVEYPLKSGTLQVKNPEELSKMPGGFEVGDQVYHCGEPDPLVPDRASGVVKGITEEGQVMVKFPGTQETLHFDYTDLTIQEPGEFRPGIYTIAEYMQARRPSKWTMVRLASRPGQVEGADLVPGTRIVVSSVHNEDSGMGRPKEILGTLASTARLFTGQEAGDLVVLQSCVDAGAPRAAVVGEPQPEDWPLKTPVMWSSSGRGDVDMSGDDDEELECQILEWNGRRMQWKVQILPNDAIFWADVDELTLKQIPAMVATTTVSAVPSPQRPTTSEMMRRAGSLANFSPAPVGAREASVSMGNASSMGYPATSSQRRWRTSAERRSDARQRHARETAKQLADEATRRRSEIRQSANAERQVDRLMLHATSSSAGLKRVQEFDASMAAVKRQRK